MIRRRIGRRSSWTAQVCALQRAAETLRPLDRRRVEDAYSHYFVWHLAMRAVLAHPLMARAYVRFGDSLLPGLQAFNLLKTRYIEDVYRAATDDGIDQLVLLGAGFDTTSLHWRGPPLTIYEVDAPSTQVVKRSITESLAVRAVDSSVAWVPCDFETDLLCERLLSSGFDPMRSSVVAWIGVSMYLTRDTIVATLSDLARLCAPGSQLILDYIDADVVDGQSRWKDARRAARAVKRRGEQFRTGFSSMDLDALLVDHGFECGGHTRIPSLLERYAPAHVSGPVGNDWLAITTATRL